MGRVKQAVSKRGAMLDWLFGIAALGALLSGLYYLGFAPA